LSPKRKDKSLKKQKEHWITFIENGCNLKECKSFMFNIQRLFCKYDLLDEKIKEMRKKQNDFSAVAPNEQFSQHAYQELLEICSKKLSNNIKKYECFYFVNGDKIQDLKTIPNDCQLLLVSEAKKFEALTDFNKTDSEFLNYTKNAEEAKKTAIEREEQWVISTLA
jgi:hypothetical protein